MYDFKKMTDGDKLMATITGVLVVTQLILIALRVIGLVWFADSGAFFVP